MSLFINNTFARLLAPEFRHKQSETDSMQCKFIWRERATRNKSAFVLGSDRYDSAEVKVYAGISTNGHSNLHIIRVGALTGRRYRNELMSNWRRHYVNRR
ncbi:hypothetical protein TNCV_4556371 [Trichonephila clavipes]|nr:hypothetical protein TNCV_4556371 [Trichonephila clavipes]